MYDKKKTLVKTAFEQAKNELSKNGKSPRAAYINSLFEEKFGFAKNEKMFIRYYTDLVENNKDRYIDEITLDQLSKYIGYKNYDDFCKNFKFEKKINESTTLRFSIDDEEHSFIGKTGSNFNFTLSNIIDLKLPEFLTKHSNMGIIGVVLLGSLLAGSKMYKADEKIPEKTTVQDSVFQNKIPVIDNPAAQTVVYVPQLIANIPGTKEKRSEIFLKQCMYWDGKEYIPEDCSDTRNGLVAIDMKLVANFKKITRPDTINSKKGVWYSKCNNIVEFFTADGNNPENGKELHPVSDHIFEKYLN